MAIGDLDKDGKADIVSSNGDSSKISVFRNTSTGGNISFATKIDYASTPHPEGISIGDLDNDGKPELAVAGWDAAGVVSVFRNNSTPGIISFAPKVDYPTGAYCRDVDIKDLDGDGKAELFSSNSVPNTISIYRNTSAGSITFAPRQDILVFYSPGSMSVSDLNADGKPEIVTAHWWYLSVVCVVKNTSTPGAISFAPYVMYPTAEAPAVPVLADLNGDGLTDIITANSQSHSISYLKNQFSVNMQNADCPALLQPADNAVNIRYGLPTLLKWRASVNASAYRLRITEQGGNTTEVIIPDTSYSLTPLPGINYIWNVMPINITPGSGCTNFSFTTCTLAPANVIISPNGSNSICANDSIKLTASVSGVQWFLNNQPVAGATSDTLWAKNAGNYAVRRVIGDCYSDASNTTTVTHLATPIKPTIIVVNGSTVVCEGQSVRMSYFEGANYQWRKNGTIIPGETYDTYQANADGNFSLSVLNSTTGCFNYSDTVAVTINPLPPVPVMTHGNTENICFKDSVKLHCLDAANYQWYRSGSGILGTQQDFYVKTTGDYRVVTVNACGGTGSNWVYVNFWEEIPTPSIIVFGGNTFCSPGRKGLASNSGNGNQWYKDGVAIPGATANSYFATQGGVYTVQVTSYGGCKSNFSLGYTVTELQTPPIPSVTVTGNTTFCSGDSVKLQSSAANSNQWYKDGVPLTGETTNVYTARESGLFTVRVTGTCPSAFSTGVDVTKNMTADPSITVTGDTTFCIGDSVKLQSSAAAGNQWYKDGTIIIGATTDVYYAKETGVFTTRVTETCTSEPSIGVAVTANMMSAPSIAVTGNTTFCIGDSVKLQSSAAAGNQWYKDGTLIIGATADVYYAKQTGVFAVRVIDNCTSDLSTAIAVTVNSIPPLPSITVAGNLSFCAGDSVKLQSSAISGNQWYKDGTLLTGAATDIYYAKETGVFTVTTTAACPSAISGGITVTVHPLPLTPSVTATGNLSFCAGDSVKLQSSAISGNQWYKDGTLLTGAATDIYYAKETGVFTVTTTAACPSAISGGITVTVHPLPLTPSVTATGNLSFCAGDSVKLQSSAISGNQWYKDGSMITEATTQVYYAKQTGIFTVRITDNCTSAASFGATVIVTSLPATPSITFTGNLIICAGDSVKLQSSSAIDNQWLKNGTVINGATADILYAKETGTYMVRLIHNSCVSWESNNVITVVNTLPAKPVITANGNVLGTAMGYTSYKWYFDNTVISGAVTSQYISAQSGIYKVEVSDINSCINSSDNFPLLITGLNNVVVPGYSVSVFPNPVQDELTIKVKAAPGATGTIRISITDPNGKLIKEHTLKNGTNTISMRSYSQGIYWVIIKTSKSDKAIKILKMN